MKAALVVDDEIEISLLVSDMLEGIFETTCVRTFEAGERELRRPDLGFVVLDVHIGPGNGLDLLRQIRALRPALPVVVMSASPEVEREAVVRGANLFLHKLAPTFIESLSSFAREVCERDTVP